MLMVMRPSVFCFTSSANLAAAKVRGLPGAAPWPSVSVDCAAARVGNERMAGAARAVPSAPSMRRRVRLSVIVSSILKATELQVFGLGVSGQPGFGPAGDRACRNAVALVKRGQCSGVQKFVGQADVPELWRAVVA